MNISGKADQRQTICAQDAGVNRIASSSSRRPEVWHEKGRSGGHGPSRTRGGHAMYAQTLHSDAVPGTESGVSRKPRVFLPAAGPRGSVRHVPMSESPVPGTAPRV